MWRNYLTVGVRALLKNRTYAFINILGLAIGMAACLMILLFVRYEFSYDRWLPGAQNVYQLQSWYHKGETGGDDELQMSPMPAGPALKKDFPQVEAITYAFSTTPVFLNGGNPVTLEHFLYTANDFLDVLPLPMLRGDHRALSQPGSIVLTQSEAIRRFGTDDVIGRSFVVISRGQERDLRVTGILRDIPKNSHLRINAVARIDLNSFYSNQLDVLSCWGCQNGWTWVKLKPGTDPKTLDARLPAWKKRNIPDQFTGEMRFNAGDDQDFRLVNAVDIHLGAGQGGAMSPGNDRETILTFAIIALLILGMAIVNFTNLATARAGQRAREVALRKVLGATRSQLMVQFIGESLLIAALAMLIALAFVELLMPSFAAFLDADIHVTYFGGDGIILPVLGLMIAVGLMSGLYPAVFLSRYQPAMVLKANKSAAEAAGTGRLRNMLVIGQFAVSIGLIVCTVVVYLQTVYARTADPGFQRDHILQVTELSRYQIIKLGDTFVERTKRLPGVVAVGRTGIGIATDNNSNTGVMLPGQAKPVSIGTYQADYGFKDAMGLQMVAGRWFQEGREMDDSTIDFPANLVAQKALAARGGNIVINELAVKRLGFGSPQEAIGKVIRAGIVENELGLVPLTIVGVFKDARFRSMRTGIDPMFFTASHTGHSEMIVRYQGDPARVRGEVEAMWKSVAPQVPFNAKFSEDIIQDLYRADDARAETFAAFAALAVIVACLGLFGLAAFTAQRRTKEIGIRKVLGARTGDIVRLLVWQFSKPVLIANVIAWPIAWWVMRDWLNGFEAQITLSPLPFAAAGLLALLIAVATISAHAVRVARENPIKALRYE